MDIVQIIEMIREQKQQKEESLQTEAGKKKKKDESYIINLLDSDVTSEIITSDNEEEKGVKSLGTIIFNARDK